MTIGDFDSGSGVTYENPEIDTPYPGCKVYLPYGYGPVPPRCKNAKTFFFDIDNCLYKGSTGVNDMMHEKITEYFMKSLNLNEEDAAKLQNKYYNTYGLAVEGLVRVHHIDGLDYNSKVDDALDLKSVLSYDKALREALLTLKKDFDTFWLVTNAYCHHALRVISFLGIGDLFDGLTFCDYSKLPIICKPMVQYYDNFLQLNNIQHKNEEAMGKQHYVDDSALNVKAAHRLGFGTVIHYVESDDDLQKIKTRPDFEELYGKGDNSDKSKIKIIRRMLDLGSVI